MSDSPSIPMTTEILEDCLQALYRLDAEGQACTLERVAAAARIATPVAQEALRDLRAKGLVAEATAAGLTEEGRRQATGVIRRHRLSERLLTDLLGVPWDQAHEEAMRYEHTLTPEAEARLARMLEDPDTCPHGAPIPDAAGRLRAPETRTLDAVAVGTCARIRQIGEEESTFLRYLASLGLLPGAEIVVEEAAPFGGPLLVRVGGAQYALGRDVCAKIRVEVEQEGPGRWRRRGAAHGPGHRGRGGRPTRQGGA